MEQFSQRISDRFNVAIRAAAVDSKRKLQIPCIIRDGSISGCRIISDSIDDLPDELYLKVPDLKEIIKSQIIWRNGRTAGVEFKWEAMPEYCQRGSPRKKVDIAAAVFDANLNYMADCKISDASDAGCRIIIQGAVDLPEEFRIRIEGLTEAVMVRLVWHQGEMAGLQFLWDNEIYLLDDCFDG